MEFDWHHAKDALCRRERGYGFDLAFSIFAGIIVEWQDIRREYGETRMVAVGEVERDFFTVVYTDRGPVRWVVTSWPSSRKERKLWREQP